MKLTTFAAAGAFAVGLMMASAAGATVIDFESATDGLTSLTLSGVTFTPEGSAHIQVSTTPNGTNGIINTDESGSRPDFLASISGGASFVSVDLGDYGFDSDTLYLRAYDSLSNLLASTSFDFGTTEGMQTLSVSAAGIDHVVFGGSGVNGSSVYADNFTFTGGGGNAVPEPSTWALMLAGFGGLGAALRRRRAGFATA